MKKYLYISLCALTIAATGCSDYLETSSPSNTDDTFVTYTAEETFKALSWCYANYRQSSIMGTYRYNDPVASDIEYFPEYQSLNNANGRLLPELLPVGSVEGGFNGFYTTLAKAARIAELIAQKDQFVKDREAGVVSDWTQLYGEALTMKAYCYFELVKHFGDVPYGYENSYITDYKLSSRFDILDEVISILEEAAPLMYKLGEGGITAERFSSTFAYALKGEAALYSAGFQTIRTDVEGLYGNLSFEKASIEEYKCVYARRSDYMDYYAKAEKAFDEFFQNVGSAKLVTVDERGLNNPYQRHFQYANDLQISPESIFEVGNIQAGPSGQTTTSEYPYAFGRPSNGGSSNAAPCKSFGAIRIMPTYYYGDFDEADMRRDVSITVTGSNGDGNEAILNFTTGSKLNGGIAINKWDDNRMNPPYVTAQRVSGINWPVMRLAEVILMQAEVKAYMGHESDALNLVNQIRARAFGDESHNLSGLSGDELKNAIMEEKKFEFAGEGVRRWDMIRSGKFLELATAVRKEMADLIAGIEEKGYYEFENGNQFPAYIYTKYVHLDNPLTYNADKSNPALYPGWRGQYDYSTTSVANKVVGTDHNLAIQGLFRYIDPESDEAKQLIADGYTKTDWGVTLVANKEHYADLNLLKGVEAGNVPPRYYWPIPVEVLTQSKGTITNGYGLAQE